MNDQEINIRYEELVREAADQWRSVYLNAEAFEPGNKQTRDRIASNIHARMEGALMEGLANYAVRRLQTLGAEDAQKIADSMISKWIKDGELCISEPTERVKEVIEEALTEYEGRHQVFLNAARQMKVKALAMSESKVPLKQIAKTLGVTNRTVSLWIKDEREELEDLKKSLAIYGYSAVKLPF